MKLITMKSSKEKGQRKVNLESRPTLIICIQETYKISEKIASVAQERFNFRNMDIKSSRIKAFFCRPWYILI